MRLIALIPTAVILLGSAPALAQEWMPFVSTNDGFRAVYPGEPNVEETSYVTLLSMTLPGRVYSAEDANGRYSTTVVDYRGINELYEGARERCKAASGATFQDGDLCDYIPRDDVAGAMEQAAWNLMKQEGTKTTYYGWYSNAGIAGRILQQTLSDQSRTSTVIFQHAGRLYIHRGIAPAGKPQPILFLQTIEVVDEQGRNITYGRGAYYVEGFSEEWRFPSPLPPHRLREY